MLEYDETMGFAEVGGAQRGIEMDATLLLLLISCVPKHAKPSVFVKKDSFVICQATVVFQ